MGLGKYHEQNVRGIFVDPLMMPKESESKVGRNSKEFLRRGRKSHQQVRTCDRFPHIDSKDGGGIRFAKQIVAESGPIFFFY